MGVADKNVGAQFDILDKAVAARLHELLGRESITQQDYNTWLTDYNQLAAFARIHSNNSYVARQWQGEQPNYAPWPERLKSKIKDAGEPDYLNIGTRRIRDPQIYNTAIPIFGPSGSDGFACGSGCGGSSVPSVNYGSNNTGTIAPRTPVNFQYVSGNAPEESLGDLFRNLLTPRDIPSISAPYPDSKLIDQNEIATSIVTALIVAGILYVVHRVTKGN